MKKCWKKLGTLVLAAVVTVSCPSVSYGKTGTEQSLTAAKESQQDGLVEANQRSVLQSGVDEALDGQSVDDDNIDDIEEGDNTEDSQNEYNNSEDGDSNTQENQGVQGDIHAYCELDGRNTGDLTVSLELKAINGIEVGDHSDDSSLEDSEEEEGSEEEAADENGLDYYDYLEMDNEGGIDYVPALPEAVSIDGSTLERYGFPELVFYKEATYEFSMFMEEEENYYVDPTIYRVQVVVKESGDGELSVQSVTYNGKKDIPTFYCYSAIDLSFYGEKQVMGLPLEDGAYTFSLEEIQGPENLEYEEKMKTQRVKNQKEVISFRNYSVKIPGTYQFQMKECTGRDGRIEYSQALYTITVNVSVSKEGLVPSYSYQVKGNDEIIGEVLLDTQKESGADPQTLTFVNILKKSDLYIRSSVTGTEETFSYQVHLAGENVTDGFYKGEYELYQKGKDQVPLETRVTDNGTISLKGNEYAVIRDLYVDTDYEVTADRDIQYLTASVGAKGTILYYDINEAVFSQVEKTGNLMFNKTQSGGLRSDAFVFEVRMDSTEKESTTADQGSTGENQTSTTGAAMETEQTTKVLETTGETSSDGGALGSSPSANSDASTKSQQNNGEGSTTEGETTGSGVEDLGNSSNGESIQTGESQSGLPGDSTTSEIIPSGQTTETPVQSESAMAMQGKEVVGDTNTVSTTEDMTNTVDSDLGTTATTATTQVSDTNAEDSGIQGRNAAEENKESTNTMIITANDDSTTMGESGDKPTTGNSGAGTEAAAPSTESGLTTTEASEETTPAPSGTLYQGSYFRVAADGTVTEEMTSNGKITLKGGETIYFIDLTEDQYESYSVAETVNPVFTTTVAVNEAQSQDTSKVSGQLEWDPSNKKPVPQTAAFTNTYIPVAQDDYANFQPLGQKQVNGGKPQGCRFQFLVKQTGFTDRNGETAKYAQYEDEVENDDEGSIDFSQIRYSDAGVYRYDIYELTEEGEAAADQKENETETDDSEAQSEGGDIVIADTKGLGLEDSELEDEDSDMSGNGSEMDPYFSQVKYDKRIYQAVVTVTRSKDQTLHASVALTQGDQGPSDLLFQNQVIGELKTTEEATYSNTGGENENATGSHQSTTNVEPTAKGKTDSGVNSSAKTGDSWNQDLFFMAIACAFSVLVMGIKNRKKQVKQI